MNTLTDVAAVLDIARDVAPELLAIYRYVEGDHRDSTEEVRLAMALIRKAYDERARREITGTLATSLVEGDVG